MNAGKTNMLAIQNGLFSERNQRRLVLNFPVIRSPVSLPSFCENSDGCRH